jgi:hypothetical protein
MFKHSASAQFFGAVLIASMFAVAPHAAQAQSAAPAAKPAVKSAAKPAPVTSSVNGAEQSDYWSVNTALPSQYGGGRSQTKPEAERARSATVPRERDPTSRVPLRDAPGGSVGFATGQSARSGRFSDGREVPGLNPNTQGDSSYVGLSLSVTSASKGLLLPLPGPYGRPE